MRIFLQQRLLRCFALMLLIYLIFAGVLLMLLAAVKPKTALVPVAHAAQIQKIYTTEKTFYEKHRAPPSCLRVLKQYALRYHLGRVSFKRLYQPGCLLAFSTSSNVSTAYLLALLRLMPYLQLFNVHHVWQLRVCKNPF